MTIAMIGAALCVFAGNLWLIGHAANLTPFWDEWDAGVASLLKPYAEGTLDWKSLFQPFNEHIIFFPRLVILSVYIASGYYDVIAQMILNALLFSMFTVAISAGLSRRLDAAARYYVLASAVLINLIPFAWQNTLMAIGGTEFLFTAAFSAASLALIAGARAFSVRWWLGFALSVAAFLNSASGILACVAGAMLSLVQIFGGRRAGAREGLGIAFLCLAAFVTIREWIPHIDAHDALRAKDLSEFVLGVLRLGNWPFGPPFGILLFFPTVMFAARTFKQNPELASADWFNVAVFIWLGLQFSALVYARGQWAVFESRYAYFLEIGLLLNIVSFFQIIKLSLPIRRTMPWGPLIGAVAFGLLLATVWRFYPASLEMKYVEQKRIEGQTQEQNITEYLKTKDSTIIARRRAFAIPYPDHQRLKKLLDDSGVISVLPPALLCKEAPKTIVESAKSAILRAWFPFAIFGIILFQVGCFRLNGKRD